MTEKTKKEALLVLEGKTEMLDEMTDLMVQGISFKEASKIALAKLEAELKQIKLLDKTTNL